MSTTTTGKGSKGSKGDKSSAGNVPAPATLGGQVVTEGEDRDVAVSDIHVRKGWNMRHFFNDAEIESLALSMTEVGQLSTIVVCPRAEGGFWLVAGEKRTRAARLAKLPTLRARVIPEASAERAAVDENFKRSDVSMPDRCLFVKGRRDAGKSNDEIAKELGMSPQVTSTDYNIATKLAPEIFNAWAERPGISKTILSLYSKPLEEQRAAWAFFTENGKLPKKSGGPEKGPGKGELERAYETLSKTHDFVAGRDENASAFIAGALWALEYVAGKHTDPTDGEASFPAIVTPWIEKAKAPAKQVTLFEKGSKAAANEVDPKGDAKG